MFRIIFLPTLPPDYGSQHCKPHFGHRNIQIFKASWRPSIKAWILQDVYTPKINP
jgi:hypothetical protein